MSDSAKEQDINKTIDSMLIDETGRISNKKMVIAHNELVKYTIPILFILRDRYHNVDGLIHSIQGMIRINQEGHEELKKEHALTREATNNNTKVQEKIQTIAETSLIWLKVFVVVGGLGGLSALVKYMMS